MSAKLTRRKFLKGLGVLAGGATLASCAPKIVKETVIIEKPVEKVVKEVVKETVIVEGTPQIVEKVVEKVVTATPVPAPEIIEVTIARPEHPAQPIIQDAPSHMVVAENTGVHLNWLKLPADDYKAKTKVWLATGQVPDMVRVNVKDIQDFADPSVLVPFMPLINDHAPNLKRYLNAQPEAKKRAIDGKLYFVPALKYNWPITASAPNIRKDLLDELGLDYPTNFDELYDVLTAFKAAYPDTAIWTHRNGTARLLSINAYPMGSGMRMYFDKDVEGGKWLFGSVHPEFKDVLDYFARCYAEGLLDQDFAVTKADKWHEKNSSGQGLFCWDNFTFCVRWNMGLREVNSEATWTPFPVIEGKRGARMPHYKLLVEGWAMGANTEKPDRIIKMLDWCWTPEGLDTTNWGVEGTHYKYISGSRPETIEDYSIAGLNKAMAARKKQILPDVFEEYAQKTDPMRSFKSDAGVGLLGFTSLIDFAVTRLWDPPGESDAWYEMTSRDPGYHAPFDAPPFNAEERDRIKEISTNVDAILDPAYDKVIIGQMSLDDYDKVAEQAIAAGTEELENIYNEAEARL